MNTEKHIKDLQENNLLACQLEAQPDVLQIQFASIFGTHTFKVDGEIHHIGVQKKMEKVFDLTVRQIEEIFASNNRSLGLWKYGMADDFGHKVSMYEKRSEIEIELHNYQQKRGQKTVFVVYVDINKIAFYPQVKTPEQTQRFTDMVRGFDNGN